VLAIIAGALEKTTVASDTRRVHLDVFELAACILGARTTRTMLRHGYLEPCLRESSLRGPKTAEQAREDPQAGEEGFHSISWLYSLHGVEPAVANVPPRRPLGVPFRRMQAAAAPEQVG
jgi:hypothetical protein